MTWSPTQYTRFERERTRPVRDLIAAVPDDAAVRRAVDLGCGPGNSTQVLLQRWPAADTVGIDSALDMVEAARKRLPGVRFEVADIQAWDPPGSCDLILANASLQWLTDHQTLYPRLVGKLAVGGHLAVQTPDNLDEPAHRLMREVARDGPWASALAGIQVPERHGAAWYHSLLRPLCSEVEVWRTTYYHPLAGGAAAMVEWFKGSSLQTFLAPLDGAARTAFLERYEAAIADAYPASGDGMVLLPFPRLFVLARR